jgi:hypothetical protein
MIFHVLLILSLSPMVATEPWWVCGTRGNYAANSAYHGNLEILSATLPAFFYPPHAAAVSGGLFANGSVGAAPDTVYGLALCHGYVNASACRACATAAFEVARRRCALGKDATVFHDACILRFSDEDFLELLRNASMASSADFSDGALILMNVTTEPFFSGWASEGLNHRTTVTNFVNMALNNTVQKVFKGTGKQKHYATIRMTTDDGSGSIPPIYSMAQCVPELVVDFCYLCLTNFSNLAMRNFVGRQRGQMLGVWCNLRYDTYPFYGDETSGSSNALVPAPAPQPTTPTRLLPPSPNHKSNQAAFPYCPLFIIN